MVFPSVWIGLLAALCTCVGLALVRRLPRGDRPRGLLTMMAAGLALFVIIEVGYQAVGTVELGAVSGPPGTPLVVSSILLVGGLLLGMVGLAWIESRRGHPGAEAPRPIEVAIMLGAGFGLHNFADGLSVGHSMAASLVGPGALVTTGLVLHALLVGAAVAAPVAAQSMPMARLLLLAACVAGPSLLGVLVGTTWVGPAVELLCLSLAAGLLIYVLRELLRAPFTTVSAVAAMWAMALGLFGGLATELMIEVGRNRGMGE